MAEGFLCEIERPDKIIISIRFSAALADLEMAIRIFMSLCPITSGSIKIFDSYGAVPMHPSGAPFIYICKCILTTEASPALHSLP